MGTSRSGEVVHGRYELVHQLGRGGAGTVWRAQDLALGRTVALKQVEIPHELAEEERSAAKQRVLREAKAAAQLTHPGVVTVYDVVDAGDVVHLVMELVEAPTLRELVDREGPLEEALAAGLGLHLLDILELAHRRGIIHRDVKPSNVFVHEGGEAQLADFGIASVAGEASLTLTGAAMGSPDYIAPEQAQGLAPAPAADLWALGATLYHAIEGVAPFSRDGVIPTVQAVVNEPPREPLRARELREVLQQLLQKDPEARPSTEALRPQLQQLISERTTDPSEAADATRPLAAGSPGTGPEPSRGIPETAAASDADATSDPPARGRRVAVGAVVVLALLGLGAAGLWQAGTPGESENEVAEPSRDEERAAGDQPAEAETEESDEASEDDAGETTDDLQADPPEEENTQADEEAAQDGLPEFPEAGSVPDDWTTHQGPTYEVAVPGTWQERAASGNRTDYVDPSTGAYLRVDHTDDPASDPLTDWEAAESGFAQRHEGYERVRLERVAYRDYDAAVWEYRYVDGGSELRAVNLNILDGDHAYALNLQSRSEDWGEIGEHLPHIAAGFQPRR